ncbi:hypothetical protein Tco_1470536 [Tanacetum coccineum]
MALVMEVKEDLSKPVSLKKKLHGVMKRIAMFFNNKSDDKESYEYGIMSSSATFKYKSSTSKVADSKEKKERGMMKQIAMFCNNKVTRQRVIRMVVLRVHQLHLSTKVVLAKIRIVKKRRNME